MCSMPVPRNDTLSARGAVLLTTGSLLFYALSLIQGGNYYSDAGPTLHRGFWSYFAGLALLGMASLAAWSAPRIPRSLLLFQWALLVTALFLTPYLLTGTPRYRSAYLAYGYVEYILREGHLDPGRIWYHSWPGFPTLFAVLFETLGIHSSETVLGLFPAVSLLAYALPAGLIFRQALSGRQPLWVALWAFVLANWTDMNYFSSQALGYFYFLVFVLLLLRVDQTWRRHLLLMLIFVPLALTHLLTSWMALAIMVAFHLVWRRGSILLLLCLMALTASWTVYGLRGVILADVSGIVRDNLSPSAFRRFLLTGRFVETSYAREVVAWVRVAYSAIIAGLAALGAISKWLRAGFSKMDLFLLASLGLTAAFALVIPYGGEILTRVLFVGLVPLAYFLSLLSEHRRFVILAGVIFPILASLHLAAHYGGDSHEAVRDTEVMASRFLFAHSERGELVALPSPLSAARQDSYVHNDGFRLLEVYTSRERLSSLFGPGNLDRPARTGFARYVFLTPAFVSLFNYGVGAPEMVEKVERWLADSAVYNSIYDNGRSDIFLRE